MRRLLPQRGVTVDQVVVDLDEAGEVWRPATGEEQIAWGEDAGAIGAPQVEGNGSAQHPGRQPGGAGVGMDEDRVAETECREPGRVVIRPSHELEPLHIRQAPGDGQPEVQRRGTDHEDPALQHAQLHRPIPPWERPAHS